MIIECSFSRLRILGIRARITPWSRTKGSLVNITVKKPGSEEFGPVQKLDDSLLLWHGSPSAILALSFPP